MCRQKQQDKNRKDKVSIIQYTFSSGPAPAGCHHYNSQCSAMESASFKRTALHIVQFYTDIQKDRTIRILPFLNFVFLMYSFSF